MMKDKHKIVFIDGLDNTITVDKEPYFIPQKDAILDIPEKVFNAKPEWYKVDSVKYVYSMDEHRYHNLSKIEVRVTKFNYGKH